MSTLLTTSFRRLASKSLTSRNLLFNSRVFNFSAPKIVKNKISISNTGFQNVCSNERGKVTYIDEPEKLGGTDTGPNPIETMLMSLGACEVMTARFVGKKIAKVKDIDKMEIELEVEWDGRGFSDEKISSRMLKVSGTVTVFSEDLTQEKLDIMAHATHARCPVYATFEASGCEMDIKWKIG